MKAFVLIDQFECPCCNMTTNAWCSLFLKLHAACSPNCMVAAKEMHQDVVGKDPCCTCIWTCFALLIKDKQKLADCYKTVVTWLQAEACRIKGMWKRILASAPAPLMLFACWTCSLSQFLSVCFELACFDTSHCGHSNKITNPTAQTNCNIASKITSNLWP